jgi:hypothetical protein
MGTRRSDNQSSRCNRSPHTKHQFPLYSHPRSGLLCHVEEDETHVVIRDSGPNPHVAHDGRHHTRWKFVRGGMASAAIGAKALFPLNSHGVCITGGHYLAGGNVFLARWL